MRCHKFPLNNDYTIVGAAADGKREAWILDARQTGEKIKTCPRRQDNYCFTRHDSNVMKLIPVIGASDTGRQTIMSDVTLHLRGMNPKDLLYTKEISQPVVSVIYVPLVYLIS